MNNGLAIGVRATPADAAPVPPSASPSRGDPAGFASLLRQTQAQPAQHLPTPPPPPAAPEASHASASEPTPQTEAPSEPEAPKPGAAANRPRPPAPARPRGTATGQAHDDAPTAATTGQPTPPAPEADRAPGTHAAASALPPPAVDPALLQWLAAQSQRDAGGHGATATAATSAQAAPGVAPADVNTDAAASARAVEAGADARGHAGKEAPIAAAGAERAAAAAEARSSDARPAALARVGDTARSHASATPLAGYTPGPAGTREATGALVIAVPIPVVAAEFPHALGVQLSVLARDGVQQAELHLNPAEMGPVSVQIVMDGTQARIDFGADAAPTRALIEQSLPDLAAALREAGLTLAGGGVSQHAQSGRDPNGQAGSGAPAMRGEARAEAVATEPRAMRRIVSAGGVDLYA